MMCITTLKGFCVNVSFDLPRSNTSLVRHRAIVRLSVDSADGLHEAISDLRVDYPDVDLVNVTIE